jgi:hypothetical protein
MCASQTLTLQRLFGCGGTQLQAMAATAADSWRVDLNEDHITELVANLSPATTGSASTTESTTLAGQDVAMRAAGSLWAQSMMDSSFCSALEFFGEPWVRSRMPQVHMHEDDIVTVLKGIVPTACRIKAIVEAGAIPKLVRLIASETDPDNAASVLRNISVRDENKAAVIAAGAIPTLVGQLKNPRGRIAEISAVTLGILAANPDTRKLIEEAGAIEPLVGLLESTRGRDAEQAAFCLGELAPSCKAAVTAAGAISQLERLVTSSNATSAHFAQSALKHLQTE